MYFCDKKSKFNIGDKVHIVEENIDSVVTDIGILGGKLSNWCFLYSVKDSKSQYTEEGLTNV